jgi:cytochrome c556
VDIQNKVKAGNVEGVAVNAEAIALHAQRIPFLFPEGSLTAKSKARPDIWQRWPEFQAAAKNLENRAGTLRDQALAKDAAAVQATVATFGRDACGTCHTPFRVPPQQSAQPRS